MEIIELDGEDQHLYHLVSHLIMNPQILNYNLNFPFRTSPHYRWFVALENGDTVGFIPVKLSDGKAVINNYYIADDDNGIFKALLREVIRVLSADYEVESVTQTRHQRAFELSGFSVVHYWKRYVKMKAYCHETECV